MIMNMNYNGTAVNFLFTEPLGGWRKVNTQERRTSIDWANEIKELLEDRLSQGREDYFSMR